MNLSDTTNYFKIIGATWKIGTSIVAITMFVGYASFTAYGAEETADKALEKAIDGELTSAKIQGAIDLGIQTQENTLKGQEALFDLIKELKEDIKSNRNEILEVIKSEN